MRTISARELDALRREDPGLTVIHVLAREEFMRRHIPGSRNVPVKKDDFVERVEDLVDRKDRPVAVYCASRTSQASPTAARKLEEAGFKHVYDFEGGIAEWNRAGLPLEGKRVNP